MSEFETKEIKELATLSYGYTASSSSKKIGPHLLRITDIASGTVNWDSVPFCEISDKDFAKYKIQSGDTFIARTGASTGTNFTVKEPPQAVNASYLIRVRWNKNHVNPFFAGYALRTPQWNGYVEGIMGGSAQPNANATQFGQYLIPCPPLREQEAIAEVLSSLDDKTDLLKRQNKTLEGMAEALFRQWFIEEAQDEWEEIELNKHLDFGSGFPFKSNTYLEQGQYRIATIKHVQDGFLDLSDAPFLGCLPEKIKPHCILNQGDVILSLTGNVGRCCMVDKDNVLLNQRVASILPYDGAQLPFWYFFFRYPVTKGILDQLSHGTAQKNLSTRVLGFEKFQLPPTNEICSRVPAFKAIFDKILDNHKTMEILESQRDTLLPKLMTGEVRVNLD